MQMMPMMPVLHTTGAAVLHGEVRGCRAGHVDVPPLVYIILNLIGTRTRTLYLAQRRVYL